MGPPYSRQAVGWDMDGVLADSTHRKNLVPLIKAGEETWENYHSLAPLDTLIPGTARLMRLLADLNPNLKHIVMSYRDTSALEVTEQWCKKHDLPISRYMLRPSHSPGGSGLWKVQCIRQLRIEHIETVLFCEDWLEDAAVIREMTGVPVVRATEVAFVPGETVQPWSRPDADIIGDIRGVMEQDSAWPTP